MIKHDKLDSYTGTPPSGHTSLEVNLTLPRGWATCPNTRNGHQHQDSEQRAGVVTEPT